MTDITLETHLNQFIANILGVDESEIVPEAHFRLDLNASPEDMVKLKTEIESSLDIQLPDFTEAQPDTVMSLYELVYDSSL